MAKFGHPDQHVHMHNGIKAALASPKTPAHLKAHLQKRLAASGKDSIKPLPKSPMFGGDVMPFKSEAQRKFMNANRGQMMREGVNVDEWNQSSKGLKLPARAKKMAPKKKAAPKKSAFFGEI